MIDLQRISKSYNGTAALHPTDLALASDKTTVLIGPSGCGKSTLLRLMIGLIRPDAGTVRFDGEVLSTENVRAVRRRMGYVIQEGGLFPHLTARDNVTLMARHLGWDDERSRARVAELAELVQLPEDRLVQQGYVGVDPLAVALLYGQDAVLAHVKAGEIHRNDQRSVGGGCGFSSINPASPGQVRPALPTAQSVEVVQRWGAVHDVESVFG